MKSFLKKCVLITGTVVFCSPVNAQTGYNWPIKPFDQQHYISGTFCENRPSGSVLRHHFHNGVDIPLSQGGDVYAVADGVVTAIDPTGTNSYIRIGRYAYVHVTPNPALRVGDSVKAFETLIGRTNTQNHVHFIDGYYNQETNPLLPGKLEPFTDNFKPVISYVRFYLNGSTTPFQNNAVSGLVEIVSRAMDVTDNGPWGRNNGIYRMGYRIWHEDGVTPVTPEITPFVFTNKPGNQYIQNVYFQGSDLSTYIYIPSNQITSDAYWDTRQVAPGNYIVEVFAEDTRNNRESFRQPVFVAEQDVEPPPPPGIRAVRLVGDDILRIAWEPSSAPDIAGYRILFSFDGTNFSLYKDENVIGAADSLFDVPNFIVNKPMFFRIQAVDNAPVPNVSRPSEIFGLKVHNQPKRLLQVKADRLNPISEAVYQTAFDLLDVSDFDYESCSWDELFRLEHDFSVYQAVLVFAGEDSLTLSSVQKNTIQTAMEQGVNWLFSGNHLASAFCQTAEDSLFCRNVLKMLPRSKVAYVDSIYGAPGSAWKNLAFGFRDGMQLANADGVLPVGGAEALATSSGLCVASFFSNPNQAGSAGVAWLSFPFEKLVPDVSRRTALKRILDGFLTPTKVPAFEQYPTTPSKISLEVFPNPVALSVDPFSGLLTIRIASSTAQFCTVELFNILGQHVTTLYRGTVSAGVTEIPWNNNRFNLANMPIGLYIMLLKTKTAQISQKIIITK